MIDISSGDLRLDAFLSAGYRQIRGMSSRFAAAICGHVMRQQSRLGVIGDMVEIGTFEGRFFIAMAILLHDGEHAVGLDRYDWPDAGVLPRFEANCAAAGLRKGGYSAWATDSRNIDAAALRGRLPNGSARFIHIDGEHTAECLSHDLQLAQAVLHPDGVIAIDDMLHPGYPELVVAVLDHLSRHAAMRMLCIIDRESITAAAKFLICRADCAARYEQGLMTTYAKFHYPLGAAIGGQLALVLTPDPWVPNIE